jgi:hypothetical protein
MDLKRNGTRKRRRGIDFEKGGSSPAFTQTHAANYYTSGSHVTSRHEWRSIGGIGTNNKLIIQMGSILYLMGLDVAVVSTGGSGITFNNTAIGGGGTDTSIDMSNVAVAAADTGLNKIQVSFGKGAAYVVGPHIDPFIIEYHADTGNYSTHYIGTTAGNILVRDFHGVDDGLAVDNRPAYATYAALVAGNPNHAYNLLNQGWTTAHINTYCVAQSVAPSNSDIWWHGKNTTGVFTPAEMDKLWFGSMFAAKGHYLHKAFANTRSGIVAGATDFSTNARPSCTAFYSGRVWYSGVQDSHFSGVILFSRLIEDPILDAHQCHMDADPTSEIISTLIASDGGAITIPEAGEVVKIIPAASGLVVFAHNGVWHIKGTADTGFSAEGFAVLKVSNVGCESPESVTEVEGSIFYWSRAGIYMVSIDQNSYNMEAQNITQDTIQSKIDAVDNAALPYVKGTYDPLEREVKFVYSETLDTYAEYGNKFLTLDIVLRAWYTGTVSGDNTNPFIVGAFKTLNTASTAPNYESMVRFVTFKQATATTMEVYISSMYQDTLVDWGTIGDSLSYLSYVDTIQELMGDAMRNKTVDAVHLFFQRTEFTVTDGVLNQPSGCLVQFMFDWADDASSGMYTTQEDAYRFVRAYTIPSASGTHDFDYGQSVITTKHNVRGSGRAFRIRLESVGNKDMHILGWALLVSGNTVV